MNTEQSSEMRVKISDLSFVLLCLHLLALVKKFPLDYLQSPAEAVKQAIISLD